MLTKRGASSVDNVKKVLMKLVKISEDRGLTSQSWWQSISELFFNHNSYYNRETVFVHKNNVVHVDGLARAHPTIRASKLVPKSVNIKKS